MTAVDQATQVTTSSRGGSVKDELVSQAVDMSGRLPAVRQDLAAAEDRRRFWELAATRKTPSVRRSVSS